MNAAIPFSTTRRHSESLRGFLRRELKPKGRLLTPFNVISLLIMLTAAVILVVRFAYGLGAVTNLDQRFPWGLWIGFDVVTGVALAGGAYVLTFLVYILRLEQYRPIVRVTILNGFLAYVFYAGALVLDLGRPWNIINPIIGNKFGYNSVLFLVSWHFMLYMIAQFMEFSPAIANWLGWMRVEKALHMLTLGAVIFGISLSILHQSGLGGLIVAAGEKISPLWQTPWIGFLFLTSAIIMGFSIVVFEGAVTVLGLGRRLELHLYRRLAKVLRWVLVFYLLVRFGDLWYRGALGAIATETTARSTMFLIENALFAIPVIVLFHRRWRHSAKLLFLSAACLLLAGAVLRFNGLIVGYTPSAGYVYFPSVIELLVSIGLLAVEAVGFIYIVKRFPVLPPRTHTVAPNARSMPTGLASGQGAG